MYKHQWGQFIPNAVINKTISDWQDAQPPRIQTCASPSTLTDCPRVVWLKKKKVEQTNIMGWGKKQRLMLGRITENLIATQLKDQGILYYHWQDDFAGQSIKFKHGKGLDRLEGTPDLLIAIGENVAISDSKTSRADSFKYVPINPEEIFQDPYWYKYKIQVTAYYMLSHWNKFWFELMDLPLPNQAHIFSYALDDGIVRRDIMWKPEKEDMETVIRLTRRWNKAYNATDMPDCVCQEEDHVKFCPYGIMKPDAKICESCCADELNPQITHYEKEEINNG